MTDGRTEIEIRVSGLSEVTLPKEYVFMFGVYVAKMFWPYIHKWIHRWIHIVRSTARPGTDIKAVISLAGTQVHKYTNDLCEGFFCSRVFFRVFDLCDFVFFSPECADARKFAIK